MLSTPHWGRGGWGRPSAGKFSEMAGDYSRPVRGGALSPSPMEKAVPGGVLLSGTSSNLVFRDPQSHDRRGRGYEAGQRPLPSLSKDVWILGTPAFHALPLSLPEEADPRFLPSPDSSPPVSICPPSLAPSAYIIILSLMPAFFTWPHATLRGSFVLGYLVPSPTALRSTLCTRLPSPVWMEGTEAQRIIFGFGKQIYLPRSDFLKTIVR